MKTSIFIDGGHLDAVINNFKAMGQLDRSFKIDFRRFPQHLEPKNQVFCTYYYHCPGFITENEDGELEENPDRTRQAGQERFFDLLRRLPRFEVRLGKLQTIRLPEDPSKSVRRQKQVDMLLGIDMVYATIRQNVTRIILVTGDSDYVPAVEVAKREGAEVILVHGPKGHRHLRTAAHECSEITPDWLKNCSR